jgi:hypothetical protein
LVHFIIFSFLLSLLVSSFYYLRFASLFLFSLLLLSPLFDQLRGRIARIDEVHSTRDAKGRSVAG